MLAGTYHVAYGYGLFTGGLGAHYGAERLGATVVPASGGATRRQAGLLRDFGATVLCATPSYGLHLWEASMEVGVNFRDLPLRVGVFGAEPWSEAMRRDIEDKMDISAMNIYGLSEIMGPGVAMECEEAKCGMHLWEDHILPEIIDPVTGDQLPPGEVGELVLTTLTKEGIPMLRYRTRDLTSLDYTPCRCGRTHVRISRLQGRSEDMVGDSLESLHFTREVNIPFTAVKEAVFPFVKFPGVDIVLSPEMKSTGEVMGIDRERGLAYLKSQFAAGNKLPPSGNVFISLRDEDKPKAVKLAAQLVKLGYQLYATQGTSTLLYNAGIKTRAVFRISAGRPNLVDLIKEKEIQWIINSTESGAEAMVDEIRMRSQSVVSGIPITTTIAGLVAAIEGLTDKADFGRFEVCSLQEYHRHIHH